MAFRRLGKYSKEPSHRALAVSRKHDWLFWNTDTVAQEIQVYLFACNLIRILMMQAASLSGCLPHQISFKHTVQIWLARHRDRTARHGVEFEERLFILIAQQRAGNRPGRIEPRAVKRRPKSFRKLDKPREAAHNEVIKHGHGPKN